MEVAVNSTGGCVRDFNAAEDDSRAEVFEPARGARHGDALLHFLSEAPGLMLRRRVGHLRQDAFEDVPHG